MASPLHDIEGFDLQFTTAWTYCDFTVEVIGAATNDVTVIG